MERKSPEEMLGELNRIYSERERQFAQWDEVHQKRKTHLESLLAQIKDERQKNEETIKSIRDQREILGRREADLTRRETEFAQVYTELESARNEALKLKMEAEDKAYERAVKPDRENPDPALYILRSEHAAVVQSLEKTIESLSNERLALLKNSLGLPTKETDGGSQETEKTDETELTARELKRYLDQTCPAEIRQNDGAEEVFMERNGVEYSFLFTLPPSFVIRIGELKQTCRRKIEERYPEIQITTRTDYVVLTGYFTPDISAAELADRVGEVGSYIEKQEEES